MLLYSYSGHDDSCQHSAERVKGRRDKYEDTCDTDRNGSDQKAAAARRRQRTGATQEYDAGYRVDGSAADICMGN